MSRHDRNQTYAWGAGLLSLLLPMLSSCGLNKSGPGTSHPNIIGGEEVTENQEDARRWSTVAITTDFSKSPDKPSPIEAGRSFCSGTLIGPKLVVTAAHCLRAYDRFTGDVSDHSLLPSTEDYIVHFDNHVNAEGHWTRAALLIPSPDWNPRANLRTHILSAPNDIGLIVLEEDAPADKRPAKLAAMDNAVHTGDEVYVAGYGVTESRMDSTKAGILRQVSTQFRQASETTKRLSAGDFLRGACAGDSGGPLFLKVNGEYVLAGITSTGVEILGLCLGVENNYTDVRYYRDWIHDETAILGL